MKWVPICINTLLALSVIATATCGAAIEGSADWVAEKVQAADDAARQAQQRPDAGTPEQWLAHSDIAQRVPDDLPKVFTLVTEAPAVEPAKAGEGQPAEGGAADAGALANKLSNPVADLISVPFQSNFDFGGGTNNHAFKYTLNVQPVIPFSISEDFNIIARIITPVIYQQEQFPGQQSNFGLGDINPTFFLSPKKPVGGWIVGVGPVFLLPTATDTALGAGKWGAGPSIVLLQQKSGWTYGILANHIWSFAGDDDRPYVNNTFLQPFIAYNTKHGTGVTLNTESTYNWRTDQWTIPIGLFVSQVLKVGHQPVSIQFGPRYYAEGPSGAPSWGLRLNVTFLFPK